ncbi:pilus assembly protein [Phenylobacterium deserti]|uniref:Putative Flp pilus-assembly TadG-like N-terminal domain-containing protein n=1 Tax=Phenylobacterium deserti TaxID=1914756 RepID=A0A328AHN7_9CAUL|nr:pilus assembly protein [Phenylobacterium deserti]RAK52368.1 hypothetical protein DJ018_14655 [Phenylobacterium deserti]
MRILKARLRTLAFDQKGAMAVTLALSMLPMSLAAIGSIDLIRGLGTRNHLQDALDAAALAAARSTATDSIEIQRIGRAALALNMGADAAVNSTFTLTKEGVVIANASTVSPTWLYASIAGSDLTVDAHSEVTRASSNVELAIVVDVTGSMAGSKIVDLKAAATNLVDLVVKDQQEPFFSKASLVPYSAAVNVGSYAELVRNKVAPGTDTNPGSQYFTFTNARGATKTFPSSTCVTERTSPTSRRYTDVAPARVNGRIRNPAGWHYAGSENGCLTSQIVPLTSNKTSLKAQIGALRAEGSTAGHIGLAWGWYTISPNWKAIWPGESDPHAYGERKLVKALVLMTDGEFNTAYRDGVIAANSGSGSGSAENHIGGDPTNGDPFAQATKLCNAIKTQGVVIYTVGFALKDPAATTLMNTCATDADHVYLPNSGVALKDAFRSIGQDINKLRISK